METKTSILELRKRRHWSQDELAEKLAVTRQAVSRWENGETVPNTDTLKLMAQIFEVSVDYLLLSLIHIFRHSGERSQIHMNPYRYKHLSADYKDRGRSLTDKVP